MKPLFPAHRLLVRLLLLATALLVGASCGPSDDAKITVYRIPKETQPNPQSQPAAMDGGAVPGVHWTAPAGWEEQPASGFRKGSYLVRGADGKTADVSVISFPEAAGGLLANVNRWRGQVNLGPIDEDTLAKTAEHVKANGHDYLVVDLVSDAPMGDKQEKERIMAAILDEGDRSWFIKMIGEEAAVESQKAAFISFLQSLKLP